MIFFKKHSPAQAIIFSDGTPFAAFERVSHEIGILATENPRIIGELEACIRGQRGGAEKITGEEYLELQSKKNVTLKPQWREEWQPRKSQVPGPNVLRSPPAGPAVAERAAPVPVPADGAAAFRPKTSKT